MPQVGDVLSGKYELIRLLGQGGMGAVYEARHRLIGKRLAVKFLLPQFVNDPDLVARFSREAQAAAAIGHRSIIDINDIDTTDDGSVYLVMEFLEGRDLGSAINRADLLPTDFVGYVAAQTLSALAAAHGAGIVHRDLKPDNIFLVDTGQALPDIKLLDFGISKMTHGDNPQDRLTRTGALMGTPYYMAPEQARGAKDIDHRVDIYAMGVILYEALTADVPFKAENALAIAYEILNADLLPPRALRPGIDPDLEQVVLKAMDRDVHGRYQSAEEMLQALLPLLSESARGRVSMPVKKPESAVQSVRPATPTSPIVTPDPRPGSGPAPFDRQSTPYAQTPGPASSTDLAWQSGVSEVPAPRRPWSRVVVGLTAAAIFLGAGLGGVFLVLRGWDDAPPPSPPAVSVEEPAVAATGPGTPQGTVTEVTLEGAPEGARVFLDDEPAAGPVLRAPRSAETHAVRVELGGHRPWHQNVVFDRSRALAVVLEPEADASASGAPGADEPAGASGEGDGAGQDGPQGDGGPPLRDPRAHRDRRHAPFDGHFGDGRRPRFDPTFGD